jgi:CHASE2 domain-containing sensor protein/signal transduction histidine kinase
MPHRKRHGGLPEHIILALLLVGLALLCQQQGWLWRWDHNIYDAQLRFWTRPAPDNIVIVAIDEDSLSQFGRWPWTRQVHAHLLRKISAENPRAIAFDIIFAEPDLRDLEGDKQLAEEIRSSRRVVLPVLMEQPRLGATPLEILPLPSLAEAAAALGHVHVELDPDGIARRLFLLEGLGDPHWQHLSLALLQIAGQMPAAPPAEAATDTPVSVMRWARAQPLLIPFAGPPGHFKQISYARVMQGNYAIDAFRDKYVLIGATAAGLGDALPTPVSGFSHSMPGVEINANILDALLKGISITPMASGWQLALTGLLALLPMLMFPYLAPRTNLLAMVSLLVATLAITATLLMALHSWFQPSAALLAITISYPLWSWRRLEQALRYLTQELDQLKDQAARLSIAQTPSLERDIGFLQHVLPVRGWSLTGKDGQLAGGRAAPPGTPPGNIPSGRWTRTADGLWTTVNRQGQAQQLGLHWDAVDPPDAHQQALLEQLRQQFDAPDDTGLQRISELVQARIQQVQQATAQLSELRRLVDDSLSNMADGVLVTNPLGEIVLSNVRAGWYLRGDDDAVLQGHSLITLLQDLQIQGTSNWDDLLRHALLNNDRIQVEVRQPDGRQLLVQIAPLSRGSQQSGGLILNFSDISPLKASENKRNELLNFLSHDLRSPLVSMLALLELAKHKVTADDVTTLLGRMESYTDKTLNLADQFLQLARAESSSELQFHDLDLVTVAMNATEQVWGLAQAKQIQVHTGIELEEAWIHGEGGLLERALVNLLGNAIKFSPAGSPVQLELARHRDEFHCCVLDRGEGIPASELPRLFDRFQRVHRKERPAESGAGLGLAFVDAVAKRHGGRVEVHSEEGSGSEFCLILPSPGD